MVVPVHGWTADHFRAWLDKGRGIGELAGSRQEGA
jgi:hypothetical protein